MSTEVSSPLAEIIKKAAARKVEDGPASKLKKRNAEATPLVCLLCDDSSSMQDFIGSTGKRKIDHLNIAVADVLKGYPQIILIGFGSTARTISGKFAGFSGDGGGTNMAMALEMAAKLKPCKTIVISDGMPDNRDAAKHIADNMTGAIDTIYCGPDGMDDAVDFLRSLSKLSGGHSVSWDGQQQELKQVVRGFLPAPSEVIRG